MYKRCRKSSFEKRVVTVWFLTLVLMFTCFGITVNGSPIDTVNSNMTDAVKLASGSVVYVNVFNQTENISNIASGIVISDNADSIYIAVCYHLIVGATNVTISYGGENKVAAHYLTSIYPSDLAFVFVNKKDLIYTGMENIKLTPLGDSDSLKTGETVVIVGGTPSDREAHITGIIVGNTKEISIHGNPLNSIQTKAVLPQYHIGGVLANTKGEVIGLNVAMSSDKSEERMVYSIPINLIKSRVNDITERPYMGIIGLQITKEMKNEYQLPSVGLFVNSIEKNGLGAKAGLKSTDIIVKMGDTPISKMEDLTGALAKTKFGDKVTMQIYRDGNQPMTLELLIQKIGTGLATEDSAFWPQ